MTIRAALVGGGRMGGAMLKGWAADSARLALAVFEPVPGGDLLDVVRRTDWVVNPRPDDLGSLDVVVVAVKPQAFEQACEQTIARLVGPDTLVVSIMAGITVARIAKRTGADRVVRAMPNTPGAIGAGITPYVCGPGVGEAGEALAISLLAPLGQVEPLASEKLLDAVTAVSGSGPAYVFLLVEALAAAGEAEGLPADLAMRLARQTVVGSGALMAGAQEEPQALRRAVTSPGGTTAAALDVLMAGGSGLFALVRRAVEAAAQRSRQLGAPPRVRRP